MNELKKKIIARGGYVWTDGDKIERNYLKRKAKQAIKADTRKALNRYYMGL